MNGSEPQREPFRPILRGAASLLAVPVFLVGLYLAATAGVRLADSHVPPGSLADSGSALGGSEWRIVAEGLPVAADADALREFEFRRSGSEGADVELGVELLGVASVGWELVGLSGGDRRFVPIRYSSGDRQGDEIWVVVKDLKRLAERLESGNRGARGAGEG